MPKINYFIPLLGFVALTCFLLSIHPEEKHYNIKGWVKTTSGLAECVKITLSKDGKYPAADAGLTFQRMTGKDGNFDFNIMAPLNSTIYLFFERDGYSRLREKVDLSVYPKDAPITLQAIALAHLNNRLDNAMLTGSKPVEKLKFYRDQCLQEPYVVDNAEELFFESLRTLSLNCPGKTFTTPNGTKNARPVIYQGDVIYEGKRLPEKCYFVENSVVERQEKEDKEIKIADKLRSTGEE